MLRPRAEYEFDFAISFAGEDRHIAELLARKLVGKGAVVFYDRFYKPRMLGRKLAGEFGRTFGPATRFFIPIVSKNYADKDWTDYEYSIAMHEQHKRGYEFILPLRLDDTKLVGLQRDVGFLDLRTEPIDSVVDVLMRKLRDLTAPVAQHLPDKWIVTFGLVVQELLERWKLPSWAPRDYPSLCNWLERDLETRLAQAALKDFAITEDARNGETLSVRVSFSWAPGAEPLHFGSLDWWEVLEVLPLEEVYQLKWADIS